MDGRQDRVCAGHVAPCFAKILTFLLNKIQLMVFWLQKCDFNTLENTERGV